MACRLPPLLTIRDPCHLEATVVPHLSVPGSPLSAGSRRHDVTLAVRDDSVPTTEEETEVDPEGPAVIDPHSLPFATCFSIEDDVEPEEDANFASPVALGPEDICSSSSSSSSTQCLSRGCRSLCTSALPRALSCAPIQYAASLPLAPVSKVVMTFRCSICLCNERERYALGVQRCGHRFCGRCLRQYLTSRILDGQVELRCPFLQDAPQPVTSPRRCEVLLTPSEVEAVLLDPSIRLRFRRFRTLRENPDMQECPRCERLQTGTLDQPVLTCSACRHVFCFMHGDAHPPEEPCAAFEERERARGQEALSLELVEAISKPCPQCKALTYKYTGCNHMTCTRCNEEWCWLCGLSLPDVAAHYYDDASPCAGRQFETDLNEEHLLAEDLEQAIDVIDVRRPRALQAQLDITWSNLLETFFKAIFAACAVVWYLILLAFVVLIGLPCILVGSRWRRSWPQRLGRAARHLFWAAFDCLANVVAFFFILVGGLLYGVTQAHLCC